MKKIKLQKLAVYHHDLWRNPEEIVAQSQLVFPVKKELLEFKTKGPFWDILNSLKLRLIVTREYEHLVLMLGASSKGPEISYACLPHPSGIAVDRKSKTVFIAASRNPNQVYAFRNFNKSLFPVKTVFYPGNLYMHDLASINGALYANAVGHNAVVKLGEDGSYQYAWWPLCAEARGKLLNQRNFFQLNSISGGTELKKCFFTATTDRITASRIGDPDFPVDGRGVVFSGQTRQVICRGLTRPHSARSYKNRIWLDNSGYGQLGFVDGAKFHVVTQLPGWTRGLNFYKDLALVGTSRVLPRFTRYAPGLDIKKCVCAVMLIDLESTKILASIQWPYGNQIFAVEPVGHDFTDGFLNVLKPNTHIDLNRMYFQYSK